MPVLGRNDSCHTAEQVQSPGHGQSEGGRGRGRTAAYGLVRQGRLPSPKLGNRIRIPRRALVAFLRRTDADAFDRFIKREVEKRHGR